MSKFHTTVSRRNFMKGLGLGAAGIGAAAAVTPAFRDVDELQSSPKANFRNPWYVRENDFKKPSCEVDWSILEHWDQGNDDNDIRRGCGYATSDPAIIAGREQRAARDDEIRSIQSQGLQANTPGFQLRDNALQYGAGFSSSSEWDRGTRYKSPEDFGVSKWTGNLEEATNLIRAASHFFGSPRIGVLELDSDTKKLIFKSGVRFENTDVGYRDGSVYVLPEKCRWMIVYMVRQPLEMTKKGITKQYIGHQVGYALGPLIQSRIQNFLNTLGYQGYGSHFGPWGRLNVAHGVLTGIGELTRISHQTTTEWGPIFRYTPGIITDLPLAPTKPINAGMFKFCETCKICAEKCQESNGITPLSLKKEPTWETTGPWNRVGVKAFQITWPLCSTSCLYCQGSCPYGNHGVSSVHEFVKAVSATTPIFNGFFTQMESVFGYGINDSPEDCEAWWEQDLTKLGHDNILGGYPK